MAVVAGGRRCINTTYNTACQERLRLNTFSDLPKRPCSPQRENGKDLLGPGILTQSICNLHYNLSIILKTKELRGSESLSHLH